MLAETWRFTARILLYSHKNVSIMLIIKSSKIRKITLEPKVWAFYKGKISAFEGKILENILDIMGKYPVNQTFFLNVTDIKHRK